MIRSLQGTSLIEYPGKISTVLFSAGCNLACPFCHNPDLVNPDLLDSTCSLSNVEVIEELKEREGFIDAVVLTGGEPLLYTENLELLKRIKKETLLLVKLDTNGTFPERLQQALPYVDFVAMDLKTSPKKYKMATGGRAGIEPVLKAAGILMEQNKVAWEFRSTMVPGIVEEQDIMELLNILGPKKIRRYAIQRFRSDKTLSRELLGTPSYPAEYLEKIAEEMAERVIDVQLRV